MMLLIIALAALPFAAKALTLWLGATGYLLQSLYKIFQLLLPALWRWGRGKRGFAILWPVDEPWPSPATLGIGVLIAILFSLSAIFLLTGLAPLLGIEPAVLRAAFDARFTLSPAAAVAVVIFLATANAALEELHFRLWLDRSLSERMGTPHGIAISALLFGSMHAFILAGLPGVPSPLLVLAALGIAVVGGAWSLLLRRPGGFYGCWLSHALTDMLLLSWGLHWLGYV